MVRPIEMVVHHGPRAPNASGSLRHEGIAGEGRGLVSVAYRKAVGVNGHRRPRILVKTVLRSCAHESREKSPRATAKDIARTRRGKVSIHLNIQSSLRLWTDCGAILIATGCRVTEVAGGRSARCRLWVNSGKAQSEHMLSGLPSITDMSGPRRHFREVPIGDWSQRGLPCRSAGLAVNSVLPARDARPGDVGLQLGQLG
jgi:hypothetical protein